jgi:hypothetical protein
VGWGEEASKVESQHKFLSKKKKYTHNKIKKIDGGGEARLLHHIILVLLSN